MTESGMACYQHAMIVYHYLNRQFGIESLLMRRLRASVVHQLKDPFEHRAFAMDEETAARFNDVIRGMETAQPHGVGIICFSGSYNSPVMWSMYGDNHTGLCLGFENIPNIEYQRVNYVDERDVRITLAELNIEKLIYMSQTKYKDWEYEDEYRARVALDPATSEGGNYFVPYGSIMKLTRIIAGASCTLPRYALERLADGLILSKAISKLRPSRDKFEMEIDPSW